MEKYGFVYIWFDRKHQRYYVGCHWGREDDTYICSSTWMKQAYHYRPQDFKRRILKTNILHRPDMYIEEQRYLDMIKIDEIKPKNPTPRYYNLNLKNGNLWHKYADNIKTIGQKISASKKGKSTGPCSPEKAAAISAAKKAKNVKATDEHKEKIRQSKLGKKLSEEHKRKISESNKNRTAWNKGLQKN